MVIGQGGADTIRGDAGADNLMGDGGADTIFGGDGDDTIAGGAGPDDVFGGLDNDTITGGDGNDELHGEDGNDNLSGDDGRDFLFGEGGLDTLIGGLGDDVLEGGLDDDILQGGADDDVLRGDEGNDQLFGESGNDLLVGGDGADILDGGEGIDDIRGNAGDDDISAGAGDDVVIGQGGADTIRGDAGADNLMGDGGADTIFGGDGDDTIAGGAGPDTLAGNDGADIYLFSPGQGNDTIDNASADAAADRIRIGAGVTTDQLVFDRIGDDLRVTVGGQTGQVRVQNWFVDPGQEVDLVETEADGVVLTAADINALFGTANASSASIETSPPVTVIEPGLTAIESDTRRGSRPLVRTVDGLRVSAGADLDAPSRPADDTEVAAAAKRGPNLTSSPKVQAAEESAHALFAGIAGRSLIVDDGHDTSARDISRSEGDEFDRLASQFVSQIATFADAADFGADRLGRDERQLEPVRLAVPVEQRYEP